MSVRNPETHATCCKGEINRTSVYFEQIVFITTAQLLNVTYLSGKRTKYNDHLRKD
ncbi:MAG: hypothetical protein V3U16_05545 [Candidatus Neomarinimicrobiota bacterium]